MTVLKLRAVTGGQAYLSACAKGAHPHPGSIQPHGVLMIRNEKTSHVQLVSDNFAVLLGRTLGKLLELPMHEVVGDDALKMFAKILDETVPPATEAPL